MGFLLIEEEIMNTHLKAITYPQNWNTESEHVGIDVRGIVVVDGVW